MVVTGEVPTGAESAPAFLDELSTLGPNHVAEFYQERGFGRSTWEPGHFPVKPAALSDLAGGDAVLNAALIQAVLAGRDRGPKRDAVLLNAGAALFVAGAARSIGDGWEMAAATIDRGQATEKLRELAQGRS